MSICSQVMQNSEFNYIKEGDYVIAKTGTALRLIQLKKNKPLFLSKRKIHIFSAVGHAYGSFFDIKGNGTLEYQENPTLYQDLLLKVDDEEMKDNRSLIDTGESQKLSTDDIEAYKAKGISGQEMVKMIVENSTSFHEKSSFSKEKYLRKKQIKYLNFVQILKPNTRLLTEMYYSLTPQKIFNLRIDSLSQMLSFCNVMSGGKYLLIDNTIGLLAAALIEKISNSGCVIQMHTGPFSIYSHQPAVQALNLKEQHLKSIYYNVDLKNILALLPNDNLAHDMEVDTSLEQQDNVLSENTRKLEKLNHLQQVKEILSNKNMDSLLVIQKNHPLAIIPLLDFLAISRPFAIFSMYQTPLVDCYVALKSRGDIISLNITETWLRKYQVMPDRTHPDYTMSGNGGFLLSGIKVEKKPCA